MWVIGEGSAKKLIETSNSTTPTILSRIRNITLKWTWRDAREHGPIQPDVQKYVDAMMEMEGPEDFDNVKVMLKFKWACTNVTSELDHIWWQKSREIGSMNLHVLVIDAREAFAPDGEFLGLEAAHEWEESDHPPYYLEIWAPENGENLAGQIFAIISGKYASE